MSTTTEVMAQIMPVLNSIGEKLGVASSHLWEIMVRQAFIMGIFDGIWAFLLILAFIFFVMCILISLGKAEDEDNIGAIVCVLILVSTCLLIPCYFSTKGSITGLVNPEYAAFTDITDRLSGGRK